MVAAWPKLLMKKMYKKNNFMLLTVKFIEHHFHRASLNASESKNGCSKNFSWDDWRMAVLYKVEPLHTY